jgi:hypothetical protein
MQEHRLERLAGNAERTRMRRVQMADTHRIRPVAMNLGVDAPFQRDQAAGMFDDCAVDVVDENLLRPHCALFRAGAGADETDVGARHADRDMAEHADHALLIEHPRQRCGFRAQLFLVTHQKHFHWRFRLQVRRS